jgi:hypothetical protein
MKLELLHSKGVLSFEISRSQKTEERRDKRLQQQHEIAFLKASKVKGKGNNYSNCTFGTPFPVILPNVGQPQPQMQVHQFDANVVGEYISTQTGIDLETCTKVIKIFFQYMNDKAHGSV